MGLIYTLPDGRTLRGDQAFTVERSYERHKQRRWVETVEVSPASIMPEVPAVIDEAGNIITPAQPAYEVAAQTAEIEHSEDIVEAITEPVQYPQGWLTSASADEIAALGITSAPEMINIAAVKASAISRIVARADEIAEMITGAVPLAERLSWSTKEAAARAIVAGTATAEQQAMITAEAQITGEAVADLAARVIANATRYVTASGFIAGQRRKVVALIDALTEPETVEEDVAAILTAAESETQALLAQVIWGI